MSLFKNYDPTHRLTKSLAALAGLRKEMAAKVAKCDERKARKKTLIDTGDLENPAVLQELTNLHIQLEMSEPSLRRDEERILEAMKESGRELHLVQVALGRASEELKTALIAGLGKKLKAFFDPEPNRDALQKILASFIDQSDVGQMCWASARYHSTPSLEILESEAEISQRDYRRMQSVIKRCAEFLPTNFNPFPGTDAELEAVLPPAAEPEPFIPEPFAEREVSPVIARQAAERSAHQAE